MSVETESFALEGGLDLVTPYLKTPPGRARDGMNMECLPKGGYGRIAGYLAYDGTANPTLSPTVAAALPGGNTVRGVWIYEGDVYAVRDFDGTQAKLYKATSGGWSAVDLGTSLRYEQATDDFLEGQTVTGLTSGATATIERVNYSGGLIDDGSATGVLALSGVTGTFQTGEDLQVSAVTIAKAVAAQFANTLPLAGRFRFVNHNFYGQNSQRRMYGVSGLGPAFEFDGTTFAIIENGASIYPTTIAAHKDHLFLGYSEGSIITSSIGSPLEYNALTGAGEIAVGDQIQGFQLMIGGVLMIGCRNRIDMLYGNDAETWQKQPYSPHGMRGETAREIAGKVLVLDDRGIQNLAATQAYGDFSINALSYLYSDALQRLVRQGFEPIVVVSQDKSQYRIYLGTQGFHLTFDESKYIGAFPVTLPNKVDCICSGEDSSGNEMILFGSDDGKVYQMETTNFFNGAAIRWRFQLAFGYQRAATRRKQYKRVAIDASVIGEDVTVQGRSLFNFDTVPSTNYNDPTIESGGVSYWGTGLWNDFRWASPLGTQLILDTEGLGQNMAVSLVGQGNEDSSISFFGATAHFIYRRLNR